MRLVELVNECGFRRAKTKIDYLLQSNEIIINKGKYL